MSQTYSEYLESDHWKQLRSAKLNQTCRCEVCQTPNNLRVHHLNYRERYDVTGDDLMTLCEYHHQKIHRLLPLDFFTRTGHPNKKRRFVIQKLTNRVPKRTRKKSRIRKLLRYAKRFRSCSDRYGTRAYQFGRWK